MTRLDRLISGKVCLAGFVLGAAVGCQPAPSPAPYPTSPVPSTPPPPPPPPVTEMIPAGATLLSEGAYSAILFKMPDQPGMVYIVDKDSQKLAGQTNAATPGESMTMADLKNVTQGLDVTHKYKIYFVPSTPTTKPVMP